MRLRKGSFVEVFSKKDVPTGSWRCAEIICGNGHTYTVKYVCFRIINKDDKALIDRIPKKAVRPCPPPVTRADDWVPGDHVEVYHNMSWKIARVMKYMNHHIFLVRLLGDFHDFKVHRSHLRVRQSWQDGKWFIIGKGDCAMTMKEKLTITNTQPGIGKGCLQSEKNASRTLKRASDACLAELEADTLCFQKMGVTEADWTQKRVKRGFAEDSSPSTGKVDAYVYPQEKVGGEFVHTLSDVGTSGFLVVDVDMGESNGFKHSLGHVRSYAADSGASSVGSCSIHDNSRYKHGNDDNESLCSDAESFGGWACKKEVCHLQKNDELFEKNHRLELLKYRRAIKVLYSFGPLSWEDEMKLVDLQDALHISNDEHLAVIQNFISNASRIPIC